MELFEAWRDGNARAGDRLLRSYFPSVRSFFANKADRDVEDLVQRTFVGCVAGRERFEGRSSFRTYLFAVANNILNEFVRGKYREQEVDFGTVSVAEMMPGPASIMARRDEERALVAALRTIPINSQVVLELFYWEQMTAGEIGEVLAIPEETARSRLRKARELMREALDRTASSPAIAQKIWEEADAWAESVRQQMLDADHGDSDGQG